MDVVSAAHARLGRRGRLHGRTRMAGDERRGRRDADARAGRPAGRVHCEGSVEALRSGVPAGSEAIGRVGPGDSDTRRAARRRGAPTIATTKHPRSEHGLGTDTGSPSPAAATPSARPRPVVAAVTPSRTVRPVPHPAAKPATKPVGSGKGKGPTKVAAKRHAPPPRSRPRDAIGSGFPVGVLALHHPDDGLSGALLVTAAILLAAAACGSTALGVAARSATRQAWPAPNALRRARGGSLLRGASRRGRGARSPERELQRWRVRRLVQVERHGLVVVQLERRHGNEWMRSRDGLRRHVRSDVHVHGQLRGLLRRQQRHGEEGLLASGGHRVGIARPRHERVVHEPGQLQLHRGRWRLGRRVLHVGHLQRPRRGGHHASRGRAPTTRATPGRPRSRSSTTRPRRQ